MQKRCYGVKWNQTTARLSILRQNKTCLDVAYGIHLEGFRDRNYGGCCTYRHVTALRCQNLKQSKGIN
jgi:hypothetical protein